MNVAVVHHLPSGGALRVLCEWLARTRASSVAVYTRDASVHGFAPLVHGTSVLERPLRPETGRLGEWARLASSPRDGRRLAAEIDAAGYDVVFCFASKLTQSIDVLPFLRTPSLFYAPEPMRSAYEPIEYFTPPDGWRGVVARRGLDPREQRRRRLDRRYVTSASRIVTHSNFTRGTLRDAYGVAADVVALGVDPLAFSPSTASRGHRVLAVGALHPLKGHDLVIDAVGAIPAPDRPPLTIVGDRGGEEDRLRARAAARGVVLDLRRGIPFSELVTAYGQAGVLACGQVREPFGLTPLEAMACETPVVAVDEGGFRETVRDNDTGLLVRRDPAAMAAALQVVLRDPSLGARLGGEGRRTVVRDWTWERTALGFDALLTEIAHA